MASSFSNWIEKLPSKSVVVPLSVPCSIIVAPGRGTPSESTTTPVTLLWIFSIKSSTFSETGFETTFLRKTKFSLIWYSIKLLKIALIVSSIFFFSSDIDTFWLKL